MNQADHDIDPPPVLKTWRRVYVAIVLYLAVLIAVFAIFTRTFRP